MKKNLLVILFSLCCISIYASEWQLTEAVYNEKYFYYTITAAPQAFENTTGTTVYTWLSNGVCKNLYEEHSQDKILKFLDQGKFEIVPGEGKDIVYLSSDFIDLSKSKLSQEQLTYIWDTMDKHYAGLSNMKKKGFSKKKLLKANTAQKLKDLLDKYMEDCHFKLVAGDLAYSQPTAYDEGTSPSKDPAGTYFEKETSNTYYVRFNECQSEAYLKSFPELGEKVVNKAFIILDARSNSGGNNYPQMQLRNYLNSSEYKGTLVILQDNWSCSSGEVMEMFPQNLCKFKVLLVGTHSAGMQNYGNVQSFQDSQTGVFLFMGNTSFKKYLPSNYLGEGKGYKPDVWATTETMKDVLEGLGIDTSDIIFN